jgi:hypothetical protein
MLLIDKDGALITSWVGKLPDSEAANVIKQIER